MKNALIRSYSDPHFLAFGLNTKKHGVSLRIQSKCGKMQTRTTPNVETFYAVLIDKLVVTLLTNYFLPYVQFQQIFYWFFIFCCRFTRQIPVRKISKFEELVKYFPYCTLHRTTTTTYFMKSCI